MVWYSYDSTGSPVSFEYQGTTYYYQKNIYNDVVGIVDGGGNVLAEYSYDEWGSITDIRGDQELARANKMRYRSYFYDEETGFYYLQSRYYDAQTGRFLNADEKFVTFNLFAYCGNDPVNYVDYTGHDAVVAGYICIGLLFATIVLLVAFFQQYNFITMWQDFLKPTLDTLLTVVSNTIIYVGEQAQNAINDIAKKLKEVETYVGDKIKAHTVDPAYKSPTEVHHIVAQTAKAAQPARDILAMKDVNISVHDPENLVTLKTGVHKHLHTIVYYTVVNLIICSAYKDGSSTNKQNVLKELRGIRSFLLGVSAASPF